MSLFLLGQTTLAEVEEEVELSKCLEYPMIQVLIWVEALVTQRGPIPEEIKEDFKKKWPK